MDLPLLACTTWQFISGNHIWLVSIVFFFVWCVIISCKQCLVYKAHKGLAFPQTKASCKQLLSQKLKSWQSTKFGNDGWKDILMIISLGPQFKYVYLQCKPASQSTVVAWILQGERLFKCHVLILQKLSQGELQFANAFLLAAVKNLLNKRKPLKMCNK